MILLQIFNDQRYGKLKILKRGVCCFYERVNVCMQGHAGNVFANGSLSSFHGYLNPLSRHSIFDINFCDTNCTAMIWA